MRLPKDEGSRKTKLTNKTENRKKKHTSQTEMNGDLRNGNIIMRMRLECESVRTAKIDLHLTLSP